MKNVFTIIKKEFSRFFKDRRMVVTVLLPGLLIYVIYSIMGAVFSDMTGVDEDYKPTAYIFGAPTDFRRKLSEVLNVTEQTSLDDAKTAVTDGKLDIVLVFPSNFSQTVGTQTPPDVKVYYNSSNSNSVYGYTFVTALLGQMNTSAFTVNATPDKFNLATERDLAGSFTSTIMPMLMFALLASGCMAVAPESIAGEKERGTMATMLITPVRRVELALGKIISLTCFALLSGISSFIGVILSLPKLMGTSIGAETAALYSVGDYFLVLAVIISVVLVIISAFSVVSAYAKSVKEAGSLISPLMILVIVFGMATMFFANSTPHVAIYLVPLLGSGLALSSIMSFAVNPLGLALSVLSNLVITVALVVLLAFMFKSEKIMFKK